jgi:hypothetical protein
VDLLGGCLVAELAAPSPLRLALQQQEQLRQRGGLEHLPPLRAPTVTIAGLDDTARR